MKVLNRNPPFCNIFYGLCCINNTLRAKGIYCSRTMTRKTFSVEKAKAYAIQNIRDTIPLIEWNVNHDIYHLRLSSDIFPHFTDSVVESYSMDFAIPHLQEVGHIARENSHRITMHPGQFTQIAAKSEQVFLATCHDLEMHADILDAIQADQPGSICVHGGGIYGDKEGTKKAWIENFKKLKPEVQRRIGIENCEYNYNVKDCLEIAKQCGIPVIYDYFHDQCYRKIHPDDKLDPIEEYIPAILETWQGFSPNFHMSDQAPDKRIGAHADYVQEIPKVLQSIQGLHLEIEAKMKELAILSLMSTIDEKRKQQTL